MTAPPMKSNFAVRIKPNGRSLKDLFSWVRDTKKTGAVGALKDLTYKITGVDLDSGRKELVVSAIRTDRTEQTLALLQGREVTIEIDFMLGDGTVLETKHLNAILTKYSFEMSYSASDIADYKMTFSIL